MEGEENEPRNAEYDGWYGGVTWSNQAETV
jgi:hypothetical protein